MKESLPWPVPSYGCLCETATGPRGTASLYYYSERDIYDAIMSSKRRITKEVLRGELASVGIFCSNEEPRAELAQLFSLLPHDYYSVEQIVEKLQPISRKEKSKYLILDEAVTGAEIKNALNAVKTNLSAAGEVVDVRFTSDAGVSAIVDYEYTEVDHGRTPMRQKQPRDAVLAFEKNDSGGTVVRFPANEKSENLARKLSKQISAHRGQSVKVSELSLEGVDVPVKRTEFFIGLINSMPKLSVTDVQKVDVFKKSESQSGDEDGNSDDLEDVAGFVRRAALDGGGLIYSDEYQRFSAQGFYISRIVWAAEEEGVSGWSYVFEALFSDAEKGSDFRCHIRAGYPPKEGGGYTLTRKKIGRVNSDRLSRKIEIAASKSLKKLMSSGGADSAAEEDELDASQKGSVDTA